MVILGSTCQNYGSANGNFGLANDNFGFDTMLLLFPCKPQACVVAFGTSSYKTYGVRRGVDALRRQQNNS